MAIRLSMVSSKPLSFHNPLLNQRLVRAPGPLFGHNENIKLAEGVLQIERLSSIGRKLRIISRMEIVNGARGSSISFET
ncbi:hypothetical protein RJ640_025066 [Escallonia rubra]|uniref:Uncharacterized protein n=1 Tax=Escallonia rubra TaxID=112253 RepID=A0AA88RXQ8_9ASTE|nr:hypothetical protein RJ640_025066 [Escallonia rubra]